jgi:Ca-activated chloride channel family protein
MEQEFDYMVTPLIFNLRLNFVSNGWRIDEVFGSPEADEATGSLMTINTLFPSKSEGGETKGGLVLLKLRKISSSPADEKIYLRVTYEDRDGRKDSSEAVVALDGQTPEYFDNTGIRKGVLLSRYAALLKNWMLDERQHVQYSRPWVPAVREDTGIVIPVENVGQWERQSLSLTVSEPYGLIFRQFRSYFESEMRAIKDYTLDQELAILDTLVARR